MRYMGRFHGGIYEWKGLLDFSTTGNPISPSKIINSILYYLIKIRAYEQRPDYNYTSYKEKISELLLPFSVAPEDIVPIGGSSEALRLVTLAYKPEVVVVLEPCAGEQRELARAIGSKYLPLTYSFEDSICDFDLTKFESVTISYGDRRGIVILSNPANPPGCSFEGRTFKSLAEALPPDWLIFVNESFGDFLDYDYSALSYKDDRVIVARSFNKTLNIQGLRAGFMVVRERSLRELLEKLRDPWPISTLAAKLIELFIHGDITENYHTFMHRSRRTAEIERKYIHKMLSRISIKIYPSRAPYILIEHPWIRQPFLNTELKGFGLSVRDASTFFGLSRNFSRVGLKTRKYNKMLVDALMYIAVEHGISLE